MKPCRRVGLDATARCPYKCPFCFYRYEAKKPEPTFDELTAKVDQALAGGLDQMVMVGYGEPSLSDHALPILDYCHQRGMATSMITTGTTGFSRFHAFFHYGMDHVLLSAHATGALLDSIFGSAGAFDRQQKLIDWMNEQGHRFCANVAIFRGNYRQLPETAAYLVEKNTYHVALLNHLPHYGLAGHVQEIAVHPADLRPYVEAALDVLGERLHTLRYFPFCHLSPKYWPYVMNARYVFFSPWEWVYGLSIRDPEALWRESVHCGESVAIQGEPCSKCLARQHCGGWNRVYAQAFGGAALNPIVEVPPEYAAVWNGRGGLFDLNPANQETAVLRGLRE